MGGFYLFIIIMDGWMDGCIYNELYCVWQGIEFVDYFWIVMLNEIDMDYMLDVFIMNNELCCVSCKSDPGMNYVDYFWMVMLVRIDMDYMCDCVYNEYFWMELNDYFLIDGIVLSKSLIYYIRDLL